MPERELHIHIHERQMGPHGTGPVAHPDEDGATVTFEIQTLHPADPETVEAISTAAAKALDEPTEASTTPSRSRGRRNPAPDPDPPADSPEPTTDEETTP